MNLKYDLKGKKYGRKINSIKAKNRRSISCLI